MNKKQFTEGVLKGCAKEKCACSCCDNDKVEEWIIEYFAFHERLKDHLIKSGIKMEFINDRVRFKNCSDEEKCKFLLFSTNKDIDPRPIDCKIYPFAVDWKNIDFDKKTVNLLLWDHDCPVAKNKKIPKEFKEEVKKIIKRDFAVLFYGARFKVNFSNEILVDEYM